MKMGGTSSPNPTSFFNSSPKIVSFVKTKHFPYGLKCIEDPIFVSTGCAQIGGRGGGSAKWEKLIHYPVFLYVYICTIAPLIPSVTEEENDWVWEDGFYDCDWEVRGDKWL